MGSSWNIHYCAFNPVSKYFSKVNHCIIFVILLLSVWIQIAVDKVLPQLWLPNSRKNVPVTLLSLNAAIHGLLCFCSTAELLVAGPRVFISHSSSPTPPQVLAHQTAHSTTISLFAALTLLFASLWIHTLCFHYLFLSKMFYKSICSSKSLLTHQSSDNTFLQLKCPNSNKTQFRNCQRWCIL